MNKPKRNQFFGTQLLQWHSTVTRYMPWKETKDPYKIWISEIILQQTRVAQGMDYYERFIKAFPSIQSLAGAGEDEILSLWKGLGYYTRARNLHKGAHIIMLKHQGQFPRNYVDILALPGIGSYTAAAIASFAFDQKYAVLDGNVYRVLSRYFGEQTPTDSPQAKSIYTLLAQETLAEHQPASYNQAIMDFGAMQCTPTNPNCLQCPLKTVCVAFRDDLVSRLPIKIKTKKIKNRYFHYFFIEQHNSLAIQKRQQQDIWRGLYELPLIESHTPIMDLAQLRERFEQEYSSLVALQFLSDSTQLLSHQRIHAMFYQAKVADVTPFYFSQQHEWKNLAFSKTIDDFLKANTTLMGEQNREYSKLK